MFNRQTIKQWLLSHSQLGDQSMVDVHIQATKARLTFTVASLTYVILHGVHFDHYMAAALIASGIYFISNTFSLATIRKRPLSLFELVYFPIQDVFIVCFGMLIDGGHNSGIYFILLVIIIGNGLRFGNAMLLFSQALCLIGLSSMVLYGALFVAQPVDATMLSWQIGALIAIPFYIFLIGKKLEGAIHDKNAAEKASFDLLDKGPLPVFAFAPDSEGTPLIRYANASNRRLFPFSDSEMIGKPAAILVLDEDSDEMHHFCREAYARSENDPHATTYIRGRGKDGNILKLMISAIPMQWRGDKVGICFLLDLTERENLQNELMQLHRHGYMSTMVAGIVHDFRNVLTNMIGNAEVMQMNCSSKSERDQFEQIITAGERGSALITHLLSLSKNRNSSSELQITGGDTLLKPLHNIIALARLQLPHDTRLVCTIDHDLPDLTISLVELEQILLNLINNAREAILSNGLIEVFIEQLDGCLMIRVEDNGIGISEANRQHVFKPFWTSRADKGGSGLGLTMVQRIVKQHHGKIKIMPRLNCNGTVVVITLPAHLESPLEPTQEIATTPVMPETQPQSESTEAVTQAVAPMHILVVDDMIDILSIHEAMLSRLGHTVVTASSADEALQQQRSSEKPFSMVITDFRMPGMDGLDLAAALRSSGYSAPILMITAYGEDERLSDAARYRVHLVNKPVTLEKLQRSVADAVQNSECAD